MAILKVGGTQIASSSGSDVTLDNVALGSSVTGLPAAVTLSAEQATSGTAFNFTGIPAGTKQIAVMFDDVSIDGSADFQIQIGDSGGLETTGYLSRYTNVMATAISAANSSTTAFNIFNDNHGSLDLEINGVLQLFLQESSSNTWIATWIFSVPSYSNSHYGTGKKSLSGELDRVGLNGVGGAAFNAGAVSIMYM